MILKIKSSTRRLLYRGGKILSFLLTLILLFIVFRLQISQWALSQILTQKGYSLDFKVEQLNWHAIKIKDILWQNRLHINYLSIEWDLKDRKITKLESDIESIETEEFLKSSSNEPDSAPLNLQLPLQYCQYLLPIQININLSKVIHHNQTWAMDMAWNHPPNQSQIHIRLQTKGPQKINLEGTLNCQIDYLSFKLNQAQLQIQSPFPVSNDFLIHKLKADLSGTNLKWSSQGALKGEGHGHWNIQARYQKQDWQWQLEKLQWKITTLPNNTIDFYTTSGSQHIIGPWNFKLMDLGAKGQLQNLSQYRIALNLKAKKASFEYPDPWFALRELDLSVDLNYEPEGISATLQANDGQNLKIKDLRWEKNSQHQTFQWPDHGLWINLKKEWPVKVYPALSKYLIKSRGVITSKGFIKISQSTIKPRIIVNAENLNLTTGYGELKRLNFEHHITGWPLWRFGEGHGHLRIYDWGKPVYNTQWDYRLEPSGFIYFRHLKTEPIRTKLSAQDFRFNPHTLELPHLHLEIEKLPLKTLFDLSFGHIADAKGDLMGQVDLHYQQKKLDMKGHLNSIKPGWIRYRPPGLTQNSGLQVTDTPASILNNYLYNFYYQEIGFDLSTQKNFDMQAHLSASGHNPDYLNGKTLKLNIRLEQNLLAAIRSMMLSYDLPSRLKDKIENVD